jgi:hypothetical protein
VGMKQRNDACPWSVVRCPLQIERQDATEQSLTQRRDAAKNSKESRKAGMEGAERNWELFPSFALTGAPRLSGTNCGVSVARDPCKVWRRWVLWISGSSFMGWIFNLAM